MEKKVRVRFAPSPTGYLHVGSARTALFNYLFAKANNGTFVLRIEDTDYDRSMENYVVDIEEGLTWLALTADEGPAAGGPYSPYRQSQRLELYRKYAEQIAEKGLAYKCYCTDAELEARRQEALRVGTAPRYDGKCKNLREPQRMELEREGRKFVYRFSMPDDVILINDLIHGEIKFDCSLIGDFVIIKSNGTPSYNFAAVIDDHLMQITHVIRGEDHLSNTPKQIVLNKALGFDLPAFAHLPMILGPDRTKLSKRHGAESLLDFKVAGYLPEALRNYLCLLSFSPEGGKEILSISEIIKEFKLEKVSKSPAIFDVTKLNWMNGEYIRKLSKDELLRSARPFLISSGFDISKKSEEWLSKLLEAIKDELVLLSDIAKRAAIFFKEEIDYESTKEILYHKNTPDIIDLFLKLADGAKSFDEAGTKEILSKVQEGSGLSKGVVFKTLRILLTGEKSGPELWRIIEIFGKEKCINNFKKAIEARKL
ncbi:MAG: glutamate--tRNA ligase [Candidatus Saganbacteria bacterium]|nr:glutamate--tRNA ligase [Candidatus Saganbacteria bacterium]